ncbi:GDSL esterase/lipase At5g03810-like [Diospyros lotus]|uniref:GDSL esterase/lipase At5g03810-like n=1 Tax=Diospyros lotus TaxID=55363 RepID=UPI00224DFF17|nr:GDSL esterase/lipase At5g03810-like [Diospyros lotus]
MGFTSFLLGVFLAFAMAPPMANGDAIVPILCIFGDSVVDVGNNNNLTTLIKVNFPPYGRDFSSPTNLPGAYLSQDAKGNNLLTSANFASADSGYFDRTAQFYLVLSLTQQLAYYKEYQDKVVRMVGKARANSMFSGRNPSRRKQRLRSELADPCMSYFGAVSGLRVNELKSHMYCAGIVEQDLEKTPLCTNSKDEQHEHFSHQILPFQQTLYGLGGRKIGVTTLPPTGCLPAAITLFGSGSNQCVESLNRDAVSLKNKLKSTSQYLHSKLPGLKLVVFDIYQPLLDLVAKPTDNGMNIFFHVRIHLQLYILGFFESRKACCGTGTIETSMLCNARSVGTCSNATEYVFWDGFHPSEAANQVLEQDLLEQGFSLIS